MSEESHIIVNKATRVKYDALYIDVQRCLKRRLSYKEFMEWLVDYLAELVKNGGQCPNARATK